MEKRGSLCKEQTAVVRRHGVTRLRLRLICAVHPAVAFPTDRVHVQACMERCAPRYPIAPIGHLFARDDHEARSIGSELFAFLAVCFNSLEPSAS